jgi:uncharacterized protein DUF6064
MSEWWTYTLQDFLMFSARTYFRMFELYNAEIWPIQIAALLLGLTVLILLRRPTPAGGRIVSAAMAACWLWIAVAFHIHRYAGIFWVAVYFGAAFALEAALWIVEGVIGGRVTLAGDSVIARRAGVAIFIFALILQPLLGPALGRAWSQTQVFGVTPDPTAVATLGILLLSRGRLRWELWVVPILWCAVSGATLRAMRAAEAWILFAAAGAAIVLAVFESLRRRRSTAGAPWRDDAIPSGEKIGEPR